MQQAPMPSILHRLRVAQRTRCYLCGLQCAPVNDWSVSQNHPRYPTVDHIRPKAQGHWRTFPNIAMACRKCNGEKGSRNPKPCEIFYGEALAAAMNETGHDLGAWRATHKHRRARHWSCGNPRLITAMQEAFERAGIANAP